jgi:hypothetical protein
MEKVNHSIWSIFLSVLVFAILGSIHILAGLQLDGSDVAGLCNYFSSGNCFVNFYRSYLAIGFVSAGLVAYLGFGMISRNRRRWVSRMASFLLLVVLMGAWGVLYLGHL